MTASWLARSRWSWGVLLCFLCALAYWRALTLPFISDDYIQISLARKFGPASGWADLARDALYRCRATSLILTYWTDLLFGLSPLVYNLQSLLLHVLNCGLVALLGIWPRIGWRVSVPAAAVFAVLEAHQEAVIWYAAVPELLVFAFGMASLLCWIRWLQTERWAWMFGCGAAFLLALLSKESGVAAVALMALTAYDLQKVGRRVWICLGILALVSGFYFAGGFLQRSDHLHYSDGTFSLTAPFPLTILNSTFRLFWVWGLIATALLAWKARDVLARLGWAVALWMIATLLPYSFLSYMTRVPSRHTYWASVAVAWIIAAAFLVAWERGWFSRRTVAMVAVFFVVQQCSYLWLYKHRQYEERARPTLELLRESRNRTGPIHLKCFDYSPWIAQAALEVSTGRRVTLVPTAEVPEHTGSAWACCELTRCRDWELSLIFE